MKFLFPLAADAGLFEGPLDDVGLLVAYSLGGVIALLGIGVWWHVWGRHERPYTSAGRLFAQLCRAHALDRTSRRVLLAVARHQRLPNPSRLFVEPDLWQDGPLGHVLLQYPKHVERLRRRLFGITFSFGDEP